jgi:hypothetical protein
MLIPNKENTFVGGPADVICILKLPTGRFHVAFFEEHPMPGPVKPIAELPFIKLKSNMHHTGGADTLEGAKQHLNELRTKIQLPDANVLDEIAIEVKDPILVWLVQNWTTGQIGIKDALSPNI